MAQVTHNMVLTQADVEALLKSDSAQTRVDILHKVSHSYEAKTLQAREIAVAEQIFRLLMKDVEQAVRYSLADRLKKNPDVPRDIILHLSSDDVRVATPVLEHSPVLSDADLVHIIEASQEIEKLQSIAKRPEVSERISDALIETHYPVVVSDLLQNQKAKLSEQAMQQVSRDFLHEDSVLQALVHRANLPPSVVDQLMQHASQAVAASLKARFGEKATHPIEKIAGSMQENTLMQLLARHGEIETLKPLVQQMQRAGRLNASVVLTALCKGYFNFVRVAVAHLASIPVPNATKLLNDKGDLGVRAIYTRTQMPESMYGAVRLLLHVARELEEAGVQAGSQTYANAAVERLLTHPDVKEIDNLPYLIALIRQN